MNRTRHIVGAYKIPAADRDVARAVMTPGNGYAGFADVIDADDDPTVPVGAEVVYAVNLTSDEVEAFRGASNCRYVERDQARSPHVVDVQPVTGTAAADTVPPTSTLTWMGVAPGTETAWHGRDVTVAVLDGGTSAAVKARFGWQVVEHRDFTGANLGADGTTVEHGCWVTPLAVPAGGRLVQAIVFDGQGSAYDSWIAAAVKWAVDAGAQVVNFSGGGGGASSALADALSYAAGRGAVVVISAGNSGRPELEYPARYSETIPAVRSSIAFSEATDQRASFSNYAATGSGAAPGDKVLTIGRDGGLARVSGTSFSAPHMARLVAMGCTGGAHLPMQVAGALTATARDTPEPDAEEGAGAWHLGNALTGLQPPPAPAPAPDPLAGFPWTLLDAWAARRRPWWTRYSRDAATAYLDWRARRQP